MAYTGQYRGIEVKESAKINSKEFYAETLRSIKIYMKDVCDAAPACMLQCFVRHMCTPARNNISSAADTMRSPSQYDYPVSIGNDKRRYFIECIRHLLLSMMIEGDAKSKGTIAYYHLYVHLVELYFIPEMSLSEKISEFLNVNFKLRDDDLYGHAVRGNFGEIIRIRPELSPAMEALAQILSLRKDVQSSMKMLEAWRTQYSIPANLFYIFSGRCRVFNNDAEECCYKLKYKGETDLGSAYLDILAGNMDSFILTAKGWLRLIVLLISDRIVDLKEFESLFEELYFETLDLDYQISLDFLSYSRGNEYHFNVLINDIPLNGPNVESLLSFASKNKIDNSALVSRYAAMLQDENDYERLGKFIVNHSVRGFDYKKEFLLFFIKTFTRYRAFVQEAFILDSANRFIYIMGGIQDADYEALDFIISHTFADWVLGDAVQAILAHNSTDEVLLVKCLNRIVYQQDNLTQAQCKELKSAVLEKLSSLIA